MKEDLILCSCNSPEHQMIVYYNDNFSDGHKEVYLQVHLKSLPFWKRIKYALRYIFGYKSKYGAWDEFIFNDLNADQFIKIGNFLKNEEHRNKKI